jgi:hypothetical protein
LPFFLQTRLSEIIQQEEISQVLSEISLSLSQEAKEGKVFSRLSEISQGAEAEEISQIMSEISQGGGAAEERSLSKIVRDLSRSRSRRMNLSNNVRHLSNKNQKQKRKYQQDCQKFLKN